MLFFVSQYLGSGDPRGFFSIKSRIAKQTTMLKPVNRPKNNLLNVTLKNKLNYPKLHKTENLQIFHLNEVYD